jgi:hypothetical protein
MNHTSFSLAGFVLAALLVSCTGESASPAHEGEDPHGADGHTHAPGDEHAAEPESGDHVDDEVSLGTVDIGGLAVELAQGHGTVAAAKESHLVVKLPYSDNGSTLVRAWIGAEDRTLSYIGKGTYAPSHDEYDVHAPAPDPLLEDALWWVEIEQPDGTKLVGSAEPIVK